MDKIKIRLISDFDFEVQEFCILITNSKQQLFSIYRVANTQQLAFVRIPVKFVFNQYPT